MGGPADGGRRFRQLFADEFPPVHERADARTGGNDLVALRDDYTGRVNTVLEQGCEDLAGELAAAYEIDHLVLAGRTDLAHGESGKGRRRA